MARDTDRTKNTDIRIEKVDDVHIKLHSDTSTAYEMSEYFTFAVPGAKFTPKFKNKMWDGKIRMLNLGTRYIYAGLLQYVEKFAQERGYTVGYGNEFAGEQFSHEDAMSFVSKLEMGFTPRDYQIEAFMHAVRKKRALLLSPTASGKSFIIFLTMMYALSRVKGKALIVVPTTSLVHQMAGDFAEYSKYAKNMCHLITSGADKDTNKRVVVSTWQSIYKMPKSWFEEFDVVIGDEAHTFKANSLVGIMTKTTNCPYKFGFTGTLDGTHTNKLVLEGLFGPVKVVTTTAELIEQKHLAEMKIKCIVLNHTDGNRDLLKKAEYKTEIDWIVRNDNRNKFIVNLAHSLKGNTLILFRYTDKHGKILYDMFGKPEDRQIVYVDKDVKGELREDVRALAERSDNLIIVASLGTFSTGVNIKNLHNIIFASPSKARIKVLQSIGRALRKNESKVSATLYDIADDLSYKSWKNHTLRHFEDRMRIYGEEKFPYKMYTIQLKE